ncbi:MAG TPA: hypothetical protein VMR97_00070 [Acidimicrobiales bacterium]|nr:hypothetical protein [Acidimicrobiales bacterium]
MRLSGLLNVDARRRGISLVFACSLAAASTLVLGSVAATAAGAPALTKIGPSNEGPYPYAYPASGHIKGGTGTTVSGTACTPSTPQFPGAYAAPCVPKFSGNNGGATYNGVASNTITLAQIEYPTSANEQELAAEAASFGAAPQPTTTQVEQVFLNYFNSVYELYGRHVVIQPVTATGTYVVETLGQGQAQACADATTIADQVHAFGETGIMYETEAGGTAPFSQCAANDHLVEFNGDGYFGENIFQSQNPYVWSTVPSCTNIASQMAQVIGTELARHKAVYAGEGSLKSSVRKFGIFIPNVNSYIGCDGSANSTMVKLLRSKYHVPLSTIDTFFHYDLDIATFAQSAQQAIVQFKAAHVTTILLACDPFSLGFLTKAAAAQNYYPEWLLEGTAQTDTDNIAQSYDPAEVDGHLFGVSEVSASSDIYGPSSPAGILYQKLTGHQIPKETDGDYSELVEIFDALQAAGPDLTPQNLARGMHALPVLGAPSYSYGAWSWNQGPTGTAGAGEHSSLIDARFVWWNANATSPVNGMMGTFVAIDNGKRWGLGQWPKTLAPLFTSR